MNSRLDWATQTVSKKIKTKKKESIDGLQFNIPQLFSTLFRLTTQKARGLLMVAPPSTLSPTFGHFELTVLSRSLPLGNSQSLCHPSSKSAHSARSTGLSPSAPTLSRFLRQFFSFNSVLNSISIILTR